MEELSVLQRFTVLVIPVLFAITVHEVAHGWIALRLGDPTAKMLGRLTLNPFRHIDPIGTVAVPALLFFMGGFLFGWAKPVPVTAENLRNPAKGMAVVALAGPLANLLMSLLWAIVTKLVLVSGFVSLDSPIRFLAYMGVAGVYINVLLCALNLLPIPPLDGGRIVAGLLPGPLSAKYGRLEPYGFLILMILLISGILYQILWPVIGYLQMFMALILGISSQEYVFLLQSIF